jgi:predicted naringenin-chalcone synthase
MRIVRGTTIQRRHVVADLASTIRMSTGERMTEFAREAPPLAAAAASQAVKRACDEANGESPSSMASRVTDCIVVSCTGFVAPGIGPLIADEVGLRRDVRHTQVGFMGCFGGILGLRAAVGAVSAEPGAVALVVCIELCSLHIREDRSAQNQVAAALFADGAAAAIVDRGAGGLGRLSVGRSLVIAGTADAMTWRIGNEGFAMTLTRDVPPAIEAGINAFARDLAGDETCRPLVHPGGPGILDAIERGLLRSNGVGRARRPDSGGSAREVVRSRCTGWKTKGEDDTGSAPDAEMRYRGEAVSSEIERPGGDVATGRAGADDGEGSAIPGTDSSAASPREGLGRDSDASRTPPCPDAAGTRAGEERTGACSKNRDASCDVDWTSNSKGSGTQWTGTDSKWDSEWTGTSRRGISCGMSWTGTPGTNMGSDSMFAPRFTKAEINRTPTEVTAAKAGAVGGGGFKGVDGIGSPGADPPVGANRVLSGVEPCQGRHLGGADLTGIDAARSVLRHYGNMSSGSLFFVLDAYLRTHRAPVQLIAFGPGLTVDGLAMQAPNGPI